MPQPRISLIFKASQALEAGCAALAAAGQSSKIAFQRVPMVKEF